MLHENKSDAEVLLACEDKTDLQATVSIEVLRNHVQTDHETGNPSQWSPLLPPLSRSVIHETSPT